MKESLYWHSSFIKNNIHFDDCYEIIQLSKSRLLVVVSDGVSDSNCGLLASASLVDSFRRNSKKINKKVASLIEWSDFLERTINEAFSNLQNIVEELENIDGIILRLNRSFQKLEKLYLKLVDKVDHDNQYINGGFFEDLLSFTPLGVYKKNLQKFDHQYQELLDTILSSHTPELESIKILLNRNESYLTTKIENFNVLNNYFLKRRQQLLSIHDVITNLSFNEFLDLEEKASIESKLSAAVYGNQGSSLQFSSTLAGYLFDFKNKIAYYAILGDPVIIHGSKLHKHFIFDSDFLAGDLYSFFDNRKGINGYLKTGCYRFSDHHIWAIGTDGSKLGYSGKQKFNFGRIQNTLLELMDKHSAYRNTAAEDWYYELFQADQISDDFTLTIIGTEKT